ncbi:MAG: hypothetical protein ACI93E_000919, partial [Flavobacteriales bacterium]
ERMVGLALLRLDGWAGAGGSLGQKTHPKIILFEASLP